MKDFSPDITKENASMVGSSFTGSKQDFENCNGPGSSSFKENEDFYTVRTEEQVHPSNVFKSFGTPRNKKGYATRYFIIKSLSHHNIQLSIEKGIWATQVMNEPILDEAFHTSSRVILIFSVNMSGFFQGYAQMMSSVGWRGENIWNESDGGSNPWGRTFEVKWLRLNNLPFQKTLHLKNPLNDYKPVKISRDCQELSQDVGESLCSLIDGNIDMDEQPKMDTDFRDEFLLKRPCRDTSVPLQEDYASISSSNMAWARASVLYPPLFYQHSMLADAHDYQKICGMSSEGFAQLPAQSKVQKVSQTKHAHGCGNPINRPDKRDRISDEDILDMTYEEYLQAVGRDNVASSHRVFCSFHSFEQWQQNILQAPGGTWSMQGSLVATGAEDDGYLKYLADWYRSKNKNANGYYHPTFN